MYRVILHLSCMAFALVFSRAHLLYELTSVGQTAFFNSIWAEISFRRIPAFFGGRFTEHNSVRNIAICAPFSPTSVTFIEHHICSEHFLNIMSEDKYLDQFWTPKHFGYFWTTFLVRIGPRFGQDLRNVQNLRHQYKSQMLRYTNFSSSYDKFLAPSS